MPKGKKLNCIIGCKYKKRKYYFRFPDDKDLQIYWLKMLGKEDLIEVSLNKWTICQKHFNKDILAAFKDGNRLANVATSSNDIPNPTTATNASNTGNLHVEDEETKSQTESSPNEHIKDALNTLRGVMTFAHNQCFAKSTQSSFGDYVENELIPLDSNSKAVAKYFINEILYEAAAGSYKDKNSDTETVQKSRLI